ncbi:copper-binding protein [Acidovorax carolinensis]|uniref:Copper-binding protein n=1 Tax=Acidovorax carolinensis TaxID=553814 RepID=A0A240U9M5_9BURK|nr:copper-binding protein [Acidovorax carolinensis]ART56284.1 copper-binding protein [Acidovorax carolinensis]ART57763.1 copper-binding protein [Acidovorax carolinensis]
MKLRLFLSATALAITALAGNPVFAQMNMDHGKMGMAAAPGMTDGEVRKIDKDAGKITIKHGEIKHMEMPGMTMVFVVKDKALLDKTAIGAKIQFMVMSESGQMVVTDIQPTK